MKINPIVVDLSHYQNVRDWNAARAAGIRGVINKATEGAGMTDKTFAIRRGPATAAGILFGGYHFLRPGDVAAQVDHFLEATAPHGGLLLALDHEDQKVPLNDAKEFLTLVKARLGRYPILYSGFLIKQQLGTGPHDPILANVKLWLSHYNPNPKWPTATWPTPWLWQYSGDGVGPMPHSVKGIDGNGIDMDSFDGTPDRLSAEWAA